MNANHLIERMVFSFDLGDESLYKEFSDRLSRMSNDGLADAIDRVLDGHSTDDVHIVIDRIEIDVGDVSMENLQDVVKARVVSELSSRLEAMRRGDGGIGFRTEDSRSRREAMLEHFVLNGRLPWWAPSSGVRMKEVFRSVMEEPTPFAKALFEKARHNTVYLKRLLGPAEIDPLVQAWSRAGLEGRTSGGSLSSRLVQEAVSMVSPRFGREKALEIVKYNLLSDVLGEAVEADAVKGGRDLMTRLFRESPFSGLSDTNRRFLEYTLRPLVAKNISKDSIASKAEGDTDSRNSPGSLRAKALFERMSKKKRKGALRQAAASRGAMPDDPMLSDFKSFLLSGRFDAFRFKSTTAEVNIVFRRLLGERLGELTDLVVSLGKSLRVRQRLLDNVSSKNIRRFFTEVMPGKKDLLAWLDSVYLETQEKVRPINQTNIRVQKSVDEVTLEILTTTDINAIGNEAFLRMHLKRMALKHNIRYRDLLQAVLDGIGKSKRLASNRFFEILTELHRELFPDQPVGRTAWRQKDLAEASSSVTKSGEEPSMADDASRMGEADRERAAGGSAEGASAPGSGEDRKVRYFLRYEGKSRKFRPWVEDASLEKWQSPSEEKDREGTQTGASRRAPGEGKGQESRHGSETEESRAGSTSSQAGSEGTPKGADSVRSIEGDGRAGSGVSKEGREEGEGSSAYTGMRSRPDVFTSRYEEERTDDEAYPSREGRRLPLPMDLLYRMPKELVRELIAVKRTMLFGKSVKALQDLLSGYLRYVSEPMPYEEATLPDLLKRIADHLDVDVDFLRFALEQGGSFQRGRLSSEAISPAAPDVSDSLSSLQETPGDATLPKEGAIPSEGTAASLEREDASEDAGSLSARQETSVDATMPKEGAIPSEGTAASLERADEAGDADSPSQRADVSVRIGGSRDLAGVSSDSGLPSGRLGAEELILHLTKYRQHYSAYHVRALLNDSLGERTMDRALFNSIVRLLFEREAALVIQTVESILSSSSVVQDASMRSAIYRAFVAAALDPSNIPFDMNRPMAEVRRRVGVDRKEPFVMPARLTDVAMYFSPAREEGERRRGKGRSRRTRERDIIVFYNVINLDLALEEGGVNFFDNILFSFELLLTRYRPRFLEILRANAYNPELAQFFAYSDDSRLFEQIRQLLPRSRTERVTQTFAAVTDAIHRLRWIDLPREEVRRFAYVDAYPLVFAETEGMPEPSEILIDVLHRASRAQLLQPDAVSDASLPFAAAELRRRLGALRFSQVFASPQSRSAEAIAAFLEEVRLIRDDTSQPGPKNDSIRTSRLVASIAEEGRFPEDHPFAGSPTESHVAYLRELIGEGEVLSRLVTGDHRPSVVSTVAEWLDREQLMSALAHRFGVPVERFMPVVRGWLEKVSLRPDDERALVTRLLLAPVPVRPTDRLAVFNRSFVHAAMRDRYLSLGEGLEAVYGGRVATGDMRVGLTADHLMEGLGGGPERWPEFYLGVLSSPSIGNAMAYRVVDSWVRYLSARPDGRTSEEVFRIVTDVYFRNSFWHQRSPRRMHQLMLEATGVLKGRQVAAMVRTAVELLRAGVPADLILEHAATFAPVSYLEVEEALRDKGVLTKDLPASLTAGITSVIGPAELARYLMGSEGPSRRIPGVLRQWIEDRPWDEESARRFLGQLPDREAVRLIRLLSGAVDLERIVLRWTAFLTRSGLLRDAKEAESLVHRAVFAGRLWMLSSREFIHAELFRRLDVAGRLRRSKTAVTVDTIRASALPATLFRSALANEPAEGWKDTESILADWLSGTGDGQTAPVRLDDPTLRVTVKGFGRIDADVLLFLETGRVPGQPVPVVGSPEFRSLIERVRTSGISLFLDRAALHPGALSRLPAFFNRSEVVEHIFSTIASKSGGRIPPALLRELAERLSRTPMTNESLLQFARVYRRHFRPGIASASSDADGFLTEALRIGEFEAVAKTAAQVVHLQRSRARGSMFVRRMVETMTAERSAESKGLWHVLERYLEKGAWPDEAEGMTIEGLRALLFSRMAVGDKRLRTLLFTRSGTATSRKRLLQLLGPGAEKRLVDYIHPVLRSRLVVFAVIMKRHFNLDAWRSVGGDGVASKLDLILQWWSDARPRVTDPVEILRYFMEQLIDALDPDDLAAVVKADVSRFSAVEKALWNQLRASVPAMLDLPPEKERRLPGKKEAEKRAERMEPVTDLDPGEGITVHNGGLVLLWPFIGRLFNRLQLTDGKVFLGEREQARAIQLTEYLVTGKKEMEEYELSLNKVVCGAPLDFPVPSLLELTQEEEDLCQKMLVGVIRNWEKMKNTRPKTFQETFLKRDARLYKLEDRWELSVERKAYDVLLDTLPWNITMFQLNWMPQRMVVHWK